MSATFPRCQLKKAFVIAKHHLENVPQLPAFPAFIGHLIEIRAVSKRSIFHTCNCAAGKLISATYSVHGCSTYKI